MKRKAPIPKPSPAPAAVPVQTSPAPETATASRRGLKAVLFALLLLLAMTVQTGPMSLLLCVLAILSLLGKAPMARFRGRLCLPVLGLLAFALVYGAAAIYSPFGSDAVAEYYKFLAAFSLAVVVLARYDRADVPGLLWSGAGVSAFISLISIDAACAQILFTPFNTLMGLLGSDYTSILADLIKSARVNGLYNDANVTGGLFAVATLLALALLRSERAVAKRGLAAVLAGVNVLGLLVSGSRGALLCFAVACLVWLALERQDRLGLFFTLAETAVAVVAAGVPASILISDRSAVALLLCVVCGGLLFGLDLLFTRRLAGFFAAHRRGAAAVVAGICAVVAVYAVAALTVTGGYTFRGERLLSTLAPSAPGSYTITGTWSGDVRVRVIADDQSPDLYVGPLETCSYTVPEGTEWVYVLLFGEEGVRLDSLTASDGTAIKLNYPLLPRGVSSRLLGVPLWQGTSFTTRLEYDKDALTLFLQSPILGHGLGSTENLYRSVQSYQYESVYAHNHLLQTLSDTGLLGALGALVFVLGSAWLCLRALRREGEPLAAVLLAAWVMLDLHSLMEINFSVRGFKCFAYIVLLLPVLLWGQSPLKEDTAKARKTAQRMTVAFTAVLALYLAVFGALLESRRMVAREEFATSDVYEYLDYLKSAIRRNVFDHDQDALSYVGNAVQLNDPRYNGAMLDYVAELRRSGTYENCSGLARYYYLPRGEWDELFACSREGIRQVRSSPDGWDLQMNFYRATVLPAMGEGNVDAYLTGVLALGDALDAMNGEGRQEQVSLTEENQKFLTLCRSVRTEGLDASAAYSLLAAPSDTAEP